ncbi:MAG: cyclic nucleotide-binding/CBS domain-containing protein [Nitrospirales bacterium]|nr:CBS domain-containing protein [Nitrospirales bacterium]
MPYRKDVMQIKDVMRKDVKSVPHTSPIFESAKLMKKLNVSALLVKKNTDFVGIITDTDIVRKGVAESKDFSSMTVESIMTAPFITIESKQSPREAHQIMADSGVRHLVVSDGSAITGLVSIRDLLVFYKNTAEEKFSEPKIGVD